MLRKKRHGTFPGIGIIIFLSINAFCLTLVDKLLSSKHHKRIDVYLSSAMILPVIRDVRQSQRAMVKQFIRQSSLRRPSVCLCVIALKIVRVLDDVVAVDVTSACDVDFVVEDGGRVVHPPLLQVGTLNEPVCLDVVCDRPPGVSCDKGGIHLRMVALWLKTKDLMHLYNLLNE